MGSRLTVAAPFVLLFALLFSGCGSTASHQNVITFGELMPMTGAKPIVGDRLFRGAKVAIQEINSQGGILGLQIDPILADTGGNPTDALTGLNQLLLDNPSIIVGPSSLEITGVINQFDKLHLPDLVEGGTSQLDHMTNQYIYRTTPSDSTMSVAMAYYALNTLHCTKAGVFFGNTDNDQGTVTPLLKAYTAHGGTIVDNEAITPQQPSYMTEITKLFSNNPQCLFLQTDTISLNTFANEARQTGHLNIPIISTDIATDSGFAQAMGASDAGKYLTGMQGSAPSGPAWNHYVQEYQSVWGNSNPPGLSPNTYDSIIIAALAMTAAHSTDPQVWIHYIQKVANNRPGAVTVYTYADGVQALNSGKTINYDGASGNDDYNAFHNVSGSWDIMKWDSTATMQTVAATVTDSEIAPWLASI